MTDFQAIVLAGCLGSLLTSTFVVAACMLSSRIKDANRLDEEPKQRVDR
jgi:hypothetical protein